MGNTPTKDKQRDIYTEYIQLQQNLILQQQQQINSLFQLGLDNNQGSSNSVFQNQQEQIHHPHQQRLPSQSVPALPRSKQKLDPYKIVFFKIDHAYCPYTSSLSNTFITSIVSGRCKSTFFYYASIHCL